MGMSKVALRGKPEFCRVSISTIGVELSKVMGSVRPAAHKGANSNGFRGNTGEDIKGMSRDNIREVRDYSNAVPGIRSLIGRGVNRWCGMRKSGGRIRT
jgi:hypothetical protein